MKNNEETNPRAFYRIEELLDIEWLTYFNAKGKELVVRSEKDMEKAAEVWKDNPVEMVKSIRLALDFMASAIVEQLRLDLDGILSVAVCAHTNANALATLHGMPTCEDNEQQPEKDCENCPDKDDCEEYQEKQRTINKLFTPKKGEIK